MPDNHPAPAPTGGAGKFTAICFVLALTASAPLSAEQGGAPPSHRFYVGAALLDFTYKEFGDDGSLLDREDGIVPGVVFGLYETREKWIWSGRFSFHAGDVEYDGQTQSGIPLITRTDEEFIEVSLLAKQRRAAGAKPDHAFYAGLDYRRWVRDIRSGFASDGSFVIGPYEVYRWWSVFAGVEKPLGTAARGEWSLDLRLLRTLAPDISINTRGLYDDTRLDLGEKFGLRVAFPWRRSLDDKTLLVVEPYLESWEFGRSETATLTQGGVPVGFVYEPRSETRNLGIQVGLTRPF